MHFRPEQDELSTKSIFNFVHHEDHARFHECLSLLSPTMTSDSRTWNNCDRMSNQDETSSSTFDIAGVGAATACLSIHNDCATTSNSFINLHQQRQQLQKRQFEARFIQKSRRRRQSKNTAEDEGGGGGNESQANLHAIADVVETNRPEVSSDFDPFISERSSPPPPSQTELSSSASPNSRVDNDPNSPFMFESLHVTATMCKLPKVINLVPVSDIAEPTLVCFIRRLHDVEKTSIDQFSMRLDPDGNVIGLDFSGLQVNYLTWLNEQFIGLPWADFCVPEDVPTWNQHLNDVLSCEDSISSPIYRVVISSNKIFYITTKASRKGRGERMCIVCNNSIIRCVKKGEELYIKSYSPNSDPSFSNSIVDSVDSRQPFFATNQPNSLESQNTHCMVSTREQRSAPFQLHAIPPVLSSVSSVVSTSLSSTNEPDTADLPAPSFLRDSLDQDMDTSVPNNVRPPSMNSESISTSESPNNVPNNIFSGFSPNAQQNVPDFNLNESLGLGEIPFPSSSWPDYDNSTSSMSSNNQSVVASSSNAANTINTNTTTSSSSSSSLSTACVIGSSVVNPSESNNSALSTVRSPTEDVPKTQQKAQKLRNLLTQKSDSGSPTQNADEILQSEGLLNFELNSCSSVLTPRPTTSPSGGKRSVSPASGQTERGRSNDILRELLHQEDEEEPMLRPDGKTDSMPGGFTFDPLASLEKASAGAQSGSICNSSSQASCATACSSQTGSASLIGRAPGGCPATSGSGFGNLSNNSKSNGAERNNMLRKLLNDDDGGKGFRKSQDLLSDHLLKENQSAFAGVGCDSVFESPKPSGQLKRKSTEDHFNTAITSNTMVPSSSSLNNSTSSNMGMSNVMSNVMSNQANLSNDGGYQPVKRLSLSEPVKSSAPSPVPSRPSSFMATNSSAVPPSSPNMSPTVTNGMLSGALRDGNQPSLNASMVNQASTNSAYQSQQLAGQNPMLAQMLAQTPKSLPLPTISIPTSIVSQVPQERLPKNLEKKLIHTPITTIGGVVGGGGASSTIVSSGQTTLSFGFAGAVSSQPNHVPPPSSMIQTSPIVVSSQLPMSGTTTFNLVTPVSAGGSSTIPHQFLMTSGGQLQPVKSILVQTGPVHGGGGLVDSLGHPMMSTQGPFLNKIFLPSAAGQASMVKSSSHMQPGMGPVMISHSGMTRPSQLLDHNGQPMMNVGQQPPTNFYKTMMTQNSQVITGLGPCFLNDQRTVVTSSPQRGLDNHSDPFLADILEQVCSMEQEMDLDTNGNELRANGLFNRFYYF